MQGLFFVYCPLKCIKKTRQLIQFNKKLSKKKVAKSLQTGYDMEFLNKK